MIHLPMICFTGITGLAGNALAISTACLLLPGVARLSHAQRAGLLAAVFIAALIPFDGLPLAAYLRGAVGDLSITTLVLLTLAMKRSMKILPGDAHHTPSPRAGEGWVTNDLAVVVGQPGQMASSSSREGARRILLILIALTALVFYPMALGWGSFDPYRSGYGDPWFMSGLLVVALAATFWCAQEIALVIALAVLAWSAGWYESTNLWDYLLDPLLSIYAVTVLVRQAVQRLRAG